MMDILFATGQVLCLAAFVYGCYLVITHAARIDLKLGRPHGPGPAAGADPEGDARWQKYRQFDS